jgi:hypothetical protein
VVAHQISGPISLAVYEHKGRSLIVTASRIARGRIVTTDLLTGERVGTTSEGRTADRVQALAVIGPPERPIVVAREQHGLTAWDLVGGAPLTSPTTWTSPCRSLGVVDLEDGCVRVGRDADDRLMLWDFLNGQPIGEPLGPASRRWWEEPGVEESSMLDMLFVPIGRSASRCSGATQ